MNAFILEYYNDLNNIIVPISQAKELKEHLSDPRIKAIYTNNIEKFAEEYNKNKDL